MKNIKHEKVPAGVYQQFTCQSKNLVVPILVQKVEFTLQDDLWGLSQTFAFFFSRPSPKAGRELQTALDTIMNNG